MSTYGGDYWYCQLLITADIVVTLFSGILDDHLVESGWVDQNDEKRFGAFTHKLPTFHQEQSSFSDLWGVNFLLNQKLEFLCLSKQLH